MDLARPGLRECDVTDEQSRRSLYSMLLAQGKRNDIVRLVNGALLRQDWPLIKPSLEPRLGRRCERHLALGPGGPGAGGLPRESHPGASLARCANT
jgi:hypothetical protein